MKGWMAWSLALVGLALCWAVVLWAILPAAPRATFRVDRSDDAHWGMQGGRLLATAAEASGPGYRGPIDLWDVQDGRHVGTIGEPSWHWDDRDLTFPPDGRTLAIRLEGDEALRLYRIKDGALVDRIPWGDTLPVVESTVVGPNGRWLALTFSDRWSEDGFCLWDLARDAPARIWHGKAHVPQFSPDGGTLAVPEWAQSESVTLWDTETASPRHVLKVGHVLPDGGELINGQFSPDGRYYHATDRQHDFDAKVVRYIARVWDVATGREVASLPDAEHATFSGDGRAFVTTLGEARLGKAILRVYSVPSFRPRADMTIGPERPPAQSAYLITVPRSPRIGIYETLENQPGPIRQYIDKVLGTQFARKRRRYVVRFLDTRTLRYDRPLVQESDLVAGRQGPSRIAPDGRTMSVLFVDRRRRYINLWDVPPRKPPGRILLGAVALSAVTGLSLRVLRRPASRTFGRVRRRGPVADGGQHPADAGPATPSWSIAYSRLIGRQEPDSS